ncbi:GGDEF domain-containing protein [Pseudarthrobacter albicanus]|uniref:GGDEF domain-containing protein n=1 Tax=Pseudarthrobacter albicanus TaxID=2823873 RepID=UPI0035587379
MSAFLIMPTAAGRGKYSGNMRPLHHVPASQLIELSGNGHQLGSPVVIYGRLPSCARGRSGTAGRREGEFMARFGGEEFVWLLPGANGEGALQAAERARLAIASAPFPGVGSLTISAGVRRTSVISISSGSIRPKLRP